VIQHDNIICPAYNICGDHVHIIILCEEEKISRIVQKLKAVSSRKYNIENRKTIPNLNRGACSPVPERGITQNHLWARKYNISDLENPDKLINAIEYIKNNRSKHDLNKNSNLEKIISEFIADPSTYL
jgi:REP element-mobilizing transposase RayT